MQPESSKMSSKIRVAVLFGGRSVEHEISIITALQLMAALDLKRYQPIPVYIAPDGKWFSGDELFEREFYKQGAAALRRLDEVTLLPCPGESGLQLVRRGFMDKVLSLFCPSSDRLPVDIFLPAFHGEFGEDGCIQGLLEMADVAYTSSGVLSSSVAMNKYICKSVLQTHGIPSLPAALVNKFEATADLAKARAEILATPGLEAYPLFVKPNHLGSSIGIGRAENETGLNAALARVFLHDLQAIVEPCLTEMFEINVSVMDGEPACASVVEIPVSQSGLLSYEEKYMRDKGRKKTGESSGGMASLTRSIDPENLPAAIKDQVSAYALKAFRLLDCRGVVRFDFMFDKRAEQIYFNELNPLPGSFSFYLWVKSHPPLLYTEELSLLIEHALKRKQQSAAVQRNLGFRAL